MRNNQCIFGSLSRFALIFVFDLSGEEGEEADIDFGSTGKKRRITRNVKVRKATLNKYDIIHALSLLFEF